MDLARRKRDGSKPVSAGCERIRRTSEEPPAGVRPRRGSLTNASMRRRGRSVKAVDLEDLVRDLSGPERERVRGYIEAIIEQRDDLGG